MLKESQVQHKYYYKFFKTTIKPHHFSILLLSISSTEIKYSTDLE